jgi:hypothetical protein
MAKRTTQKPQAQQQAQIQVDVRADTPSYYVNFIAVSHTAYDFTLSATRIPSPLTAEQVELAKNGEPIPLEPILQLVVPPLLVDGLIKALIDQKTRHEQTLAQQVKNNEILQHNRPLGSVH